MESISFVIEECSFVVKNRGARERACTIRVHSILNHWLDCLVLYTTESRSI